MLLLELTKRLNDSDPQVRYICTFLYEMVNEQQKQLDMLANIATMLAEQNHQILKRMDSQSENAALEIVKQLKEFGKTPGVEVSSVANDPEKDNG